MRTILSNVLSSINTKKTKQSFKLRNGTPTLITDVAKILLIFLLFLYKTFFFVVGARTFNVDEAYSMVYLFILTTNTTGQIITYLYSGAALQRCSLERVFWKYALQLYWNHTSAWVHIFRATFLKNHSGELLLCVTWIITYLNYCISNEFDKIHCKELFNSNSQLTFLNTCFRPYVSFLFIEVYWQS